MNCWSEAARPCAPKCAPERHGGRSKPPRLRRVFVTLLHIMILCVLAASTAANAATFHAIMIGDTHAADIGKSVQADVRMARNFANGLAEHFQTKNIHVLTGKDATPQGVKTAISRLDLGLDDFLFLYYSGHGTTSRSDSPWPLLGLGEGIEAQELLLHVGNKVPSRYLAVFDACNGAEEMPARRSPASFDFNAEQVQRLIKSLKGNVIVTSSKAPYVSYADAGGRGSRFSTAFFSTVADVLTSPASTAKWDQILTNVVQQTENAAGTKKQTPKFLMTRQ